MGEVKPALTPEEWREALGPYEEWEEPGDYMLPISRHWEFYGDYHQLDRIHEAAARLLYGQPFGFTWDDVDALRHVLEHASNSDDRGPYGEGWQSDELASAIATARTVVEKLAALLPPR